MTKLNVLRRPSAPFDRPELTSGWYKFRKNRGVQATTILVVVLGTGLLVFEAATRLS
jgi:hypothetical protein